MLLALLPLIGIEACAPCHRQQTTHYPGTPMAKALERVADSAILQRHPKLAFQEGRYRSQIVRDGDKSILTVTDGEKSFTIPLAWAFGRGQAGQTYVFEWNGAFYESRLSFFGAIEALDLTMGAQGTKAAGVEQAAGRRMSSREGRDCFGCHSTAGTPGVGCEACHGGAAKHAAAVRAGNAAEAKLPKLSTLGAEDMSELCGRCHRTWSQIATERAPGRK